MTEHPSWLWIVFFVNTILIAVVVASIILLMTQQHYLIHEVNEIDTKLIQAIKINQNNVETVAKKAGVPERKIMRPELPIVPNVK